MKCILDTYQGYIERVRTSEADKCVHENPDRYCFVPKSAWKAQKAAEVDNAR